VKHTNRPFLRYLFPARAGKLATLWCIGVAAAGLSLVLPFVIRQLTLLCGGANGGTTHVDMVKVTKWILVLLGSQLAFAAVNYWRKWIEGGLQEAVARQLMLDTFARVVRFSAEFFRDREVEKINSRVLDDANAVGKFLVNAAVVAPVALISMVVFAVVMMAHNLFLGACMIPLALLSRYYTFFDPKVQRLTRRGREVWDTIRTQGSEVVTLTPELRGHYAFEYGLAGIKRSFDRYRKVLVEMAQLQALFQAITPLVGVVQYGTLFWLGSALCSDHSPLLRIARPMDWGGVIEFMLIVQLFQKPSLDLGLFLIEWRMTRENLRRVAEYFEQPLVFDRAKSTLPVPDKSDVAYDDVSVWTGSGSKILNGLKLTIGAGEHVAFCGPAGCGKTTAMQLVVRGVEPAAGQLKLAGRGIEEYDILRIAQHLAFVAQKPLLMDATLRNNILLGLRREVDGCLRDDEGPLDVSLLTDVKDLPALDRELLRLLRLVAMEDDVFRKCLDNPAPPGAHAETFQLRATELNQAVAQAMQRGGASEVIAFHESTWFPGTLRDNLLGPGATPDGDRQIMAALSGQDFLEELIRLGTRRLRAERLLAVKVAQQAPALLEFLPSYLDAGGNADVEDVPHAKESELSPSVRQTLLGVALGVDAEIALSYLRNSGDETIPAAFREKAIASRRALTAADPACRRRWEDIAAGRYVETLSVRENLLGGRVNPRVLGAAERVDGILKGVLEKSGLLPAALLMGLEFRVGEGGKYLSGGQRQKLSIARAVIKNPSILLMDEATASLDESSQAKVVEMIRGGFKDKTVVSISHRLSTIRDFDKIVVLDRGEVTQVGTYQDLAIADGVFRELVNQERGVASQPVALRNTAVPELHDLQRQLALSDVFGSMNEEQLTFLARAARVVDCRPGEVLFRRGDSGGELYLVLDGSVTFSTDRPPDPATVVATYGPGRVFGELALFGHGLRTLTARTGPATRLMALGREDLIRLMTADHRIAIGLLSAIARRLIEADERRYATSQSPAQ